MLTLVEFAWYFLHCPLAPRKIGARFAPTTTTGIFKENCVINVYDFLKTIFWKPKSWIRQNNSDPYKSRSASLLYFWNNCRLMTRSHLYEETHVHVGLLQPEPVERGPEHEKAAVVLPPHGPVDLLPKANLLRGDTKALAAGVISGNHRVGQRSQRSTSNIDG